MVDGNTQILKQMCACEIFTVPVQRVHESKNLLLSFLQVLLLYNHRRVSCIPFALCAMYVCGYVYNTLCSKLHKSWAHYQQLLL